MTDMKPDMALLRIISDSELRLGEVIGSGAFGTVYSVSLHATVAFNYCSVFKTTLQSAFLNI